VKKAELRLKAAPGRILLRFPLAEQKTEGGVIIPETSQMRPEFAEIVDIGTPRDESERICAEFFRECQEKGLPVAVSFAAGVPYWKENYDPRKWGWLQSLRSYQLTAPAAVFERVDVETADEELPEPAVAGV
jgi:hypothetical protein